MAQSTTLTETDYDQDYSDDRPSARDVLTGTTSAERRALPHVKHGNEILKTRGQFLNNSVGDAVEEPSELSLWKLATLLRAKGEAAGICSRVERTETEKILLHELLNKDPWVGKLGSTEWDPTPGKNFRPHELIGTKATLLGDDATSGGDEITPVVVDEALVTFPLLFGELFPMVEVRPVARGRLVEGASFGNPTVTWGAANVGDGNAVTLFTTDSLVSELNTSVHPVSAALNVGRDFLTDAIQNVVQEINASLGRRLAESLDEQIAIGDGTTEPEGIFVASGTTSVAAGSGTSGPPLVTDPINLMFAVPKQYRQRNDRCAYLSNDTSYKRLRSVATGVTGDARLLFGNDLSGYKVFDWPHLIQNGVSENQFAFCCMNKYRLYRRVGAEFRFIDSGQTMALNNTVAMLIRARYGGRVMDASAFATMTDFAVEDA